MKSIKIIALAAAAVALPGCSIISPAPVIELAKATGAVAVHVATPTPSNSM